MEISILSNFSEFLLTCPCSIYRMTDILGLEHPDDPNISYGDVNSSIWMF